jgi:hypothetical protein
MSDLTFEWDGNVYVVGDAGIDAAAEWIAALRSSKLGLLKLFEGGHHDERQALAIHWLDDVGLIRPPYERFTAWLILLTVAHHLPILDLGTFAQ